MKVYISSTYLDLAECRQKVYDTLRAFRYDVLAMEDYVATDERPVNTCLADVRSCDVYVGIFAWRYGYIPPGQTYSITELEYREACRVRCPCLIFLANEDAPWPRRYVEGGEGGAQLERLRADLRQRHGVAFFSTAEQLARQVAEAMWKFSQQQLDSEMTALRADSAAIDQQRRRLGPQRIVNLPPLEVTRFCDRKQELTMLRHFLLDEHVYLARVLGRGGMGKTALIVYLLSELEHTLERLVQTDVTEPSAAAIDGILYLSSRSTGLNIERIYADLKRMLEPEAVEQLELAWRAADVTAQQQVEVLLETLRDRRIVLLLDGLEQVLDADRRIADKALAVFVEGCLRHGRGPVLVITSRVDLWLPPAVLPVTREICLQSGLPPEDGAVLLRALDPQGILGLRDAPSAQLLRAAALVDGIPRALEVLAGILQRDPTANLTRLLADEQTLESQTAEDLVAEGYRCLSLDEQHVMQVLAVLDAPATETAVKFVLHPWFPGIDVRTSLSRLSGSYFVIPNRRTGTFSLQPLDRQHAYDQIPTYVPNAADSGWQRQAIELRAADFYASIRKPPEQWLSIEDVEPQLAEFDLRVRGGDSDGAMTVLNAIEDRYLFQLGYYTTLIERHRRLVDQPPSPVLQIDNLAGLAACYQVLCQYDAAIDYYKRAIAVARSICDRGREVNVVGNLGRLYRNLGYMHRARDCFAQALADAQTGGDRKAEAAWRDRLGLAEGSLGHLAAAAQLHQKAIELAQANGDRRTEGAAFSNLGLIRQAEGNYAAAESCFRHALRIAVQISDRRGEAICLGRLATALCLMGQSAAARQQYEAALAIAIDLGERREQSYQLLGLGRVALITGDAALATQHLAASRALAVPETSYLAAVSLGIAWLLCRSPSQAAAVFSDAVSCCRDRLKRCTQLYLARYALGTALLGTASCNDSWAVIDQRASLIAPAQTVYERAIAQCPAAGVISATLADLQWMRASGIAGLNSIIQLLEAVTR